MVLIIEKSVLCSDILDVVLFNETLKSALLMCLHCFTYHIFLYLHLQHKGGNLCLIIGQSGRFIISRNVFSSFASQDVHEILKLFHVRTLILIY